ncbi:MAG: SAM-dependent methyltransferase, partial [Bdellovibrionota bacterium]
VSASGLPTDRFLFAGFPPQKDSGRRKFLEDLATERATILLHEAPNRLAELLKDISEIFGEHRRVVIGRELTKIHEEIIRGTAGELASRYSSENPAGEIVLAIEGDREQKPEPTQDILDAEIRRAMREEGLSLRDASERLSRKYGLPRKRIYRRALELAGQVSPETPAEPS